MRALFTTIFLQLATLVWGQTDLPLAESVLVDKSERKMWLIHEGRKYREYDISLGDSPVGHKEREGDEKTPEGSYIIYYRNPESRFYLSLHISYPREEDEEKAQRKGVMPGGNIFIHGLPNGLEKMSSSYVGRDWTDGCIAVSNQAIEELWVLVQDGTPIEILH